MKQFFKEGIIHGLGLTNALILISWLSVDFHYLGDDIGQWVGLIIIPIITVLYSLISGIMYIVKEVKEHRNADRVIDNE